ncbi:MAG: hypothetical protein LBP22_01430 [Deltaproteobacteria bacterium]|nr:hypothetical protein [Deltaproteobacteria bacterium]
MTFQLERREAVKGLIYPAVPDFRPGIGLTFQPLEESRPLGSESPISAGACLWIPGGGCPNWPSTSRLAEIG